MYTYTFKNKSYQFNVEASLKMGKDAFIEAHKGVPNIKLVWENMQPLVEVEKPKTSKK